MGGMDAERACRTLGACARAGARSRRSTREGVGERGARAESAMHLDSLCLVCEVLAIPSTIRLAFCINIINIYNYLAQFKSCATLRMGGRGRGGARPGMRRVAQDLNYAICLKY